MKDALSACAESGYDIDELFGTPELKAEELMRAYDAALARQGRAPATRKKYVPTVGVFLKWAEARPDRPTTAVDVDLFLSSWEAALEEQIGRRPQRSTVRAQVAALRSFFLYLERSRLLVDVDGRPATNPMASVVAPSVEQRPNDFLRPLEDSALLECVSPPAERLVVWLLRWTGLRVAEACALRLEDLDLTPERESLAVRKSKTTAGMRTIPLCLVCCPNWKPGSGS